MSTGTKLRCAACEKPIPQSEPDVMLRRLDSEETIYYHTRCVGGAMVMAMLEPGVWIMSVRHVEEEAN